MGFKLPHYSHSHLHGESVLEEKNEKELNFFPRCIAGFLNSCFTYDLETHFTFICFQLFKIKVIFITNILLNSVGV